MTRICRVALAAVTALAAGVLPAAAAGQPAASCNIAPAASARIASVRDARTLRLADGNLLRLADLAGFADLGLGPAGAQAEANAVTALTALSRSKTVRLHLIGTDRYGRRVGYAFSGAGDGSPSIQRQLLAEGQAVVAARVEPAGCAAPLLSAERKARTRRLGIWADAADLIRHADRPARLERMRGRFALVQGKVLSVRDWGATIYVNFGRRWSRDFTVTIPKRYRHRFIAAGLNPHSLAGHRVNVRGWLDERSGPWIEVTRPAQIEFADGS